MTLENQVCTLEQAKRLKELGVTQHSVTHWIEDETIKTHLAFSFKGKMLCCYSDGSTGLEVPLSGHKMISYAAFTVAELGVMLPAEIEPHTLQIDKHEAGTWQAGYMDSNNYSKWLSSVTPTMAEAMAHTLILLLESGDVTTDEGNARLSAA